MTDTPESTVQNHDVIIIGGGLAGLAAAGAAHDAGLKVAVLEASDGVGGRARSDVIDGFRIDRGFQVLLTAYPQARRMFDMGALELRAFEPGAVVWTGERMSRVSDPLRRRRHVAESVMSPVGTLSDKMRLLAWRRRVTRGNDAYEAMLRSPETTAADALSHREGFSRAMIDRFLAPLYRGIFLEPELDSSSRMLDFTFRMFASGDTAVPARGMGAMALQLSSRLPLGSVHLDTRVEAIEDGATVRTTGGERHSARAVVVAVDGWSAHELLGDGDAHDPGAAATTCLWFAAHRSPAPEGMLVLNGAGAHDGPVNHLAVMSDIAPEYAPEGAALVAVNVVGIPAGDDAAIEAAVREQLGRWYGEAELAPWRLLALQRITHALPDQSPPWLTRREWPVELSPGRYVCGDWRDTASIDGALRSGAAAGAAAVAYVRGG